MRFPLRPSLFLIATIALGFPHAQARSNQESERNTANHVCKHHREYKPQILSQSCERGNGANSEDQRLRGPLIAISGSMNDFANKAKSRCKDLIESYFALKGWIDAEIKTGADEVSSIAMVNENIAEDDEAARGQRQALQDTKRMHDANAELGRKLETKFAKTQEDVRKLKAEIAERLKRYEAIPRPFQNARLAACNEDKTQLTRNAVNLHRDYKQLESFYFNLDDQLLAERKKNTDRTAGSIQASRQLEARLKSLSDDWGVAQPIVDQADRKPASVPPAAEKPAPALDHTGGKKLTAQDYAKQDAYVKSLGAEIPDRAANAAKWSSNELVPPTYRSVASARTLEYQAAVNDAYNQIYGTYGYGIGPSLTQDGVLGTRTKAATGHLMSSPMGAAALEAALKARGLIP
jgi:hypothetical protein